MWTFQINHEFIFKLFKLFDYISYNYFLRIVKIIYDTYVQDFQTYRRIYGSCVLPKIKVKKKKKKMKPHLF